MTNRKRQIIIGTVLGGSSLIRRGNNRFHHLAMASQESLWLEYKMQELCHIFPKHSLQLDKKTYRCVSITDEELTDIHELMFRNGKRCITTDLLDSILDITLAMWYLDGGGKTGRNKKNAYLNTTRFGVEGTNLIAGYFSDMLGWECSVSNMSTRSRIVFSVESTCALFKTITHLFPKFMHHRI